MVYRRSKTNIRKPVRRRAAARRAPVRRRLSRRRPNARNPRHVAVSLTPTSRFVLAQMDPFDPKALGAKVPDSNTMPSLANCDTDLNSFPIPISTGNLLACAFAPSYRSSFNTAAQGGVAAVSWPSFYSSRRNYNNIQNSLEAIRPVAHAVRISSPLAPTSTVGFVHIGLSVESSWNEVAGSDFPYPSTINEMAGLSYYKRVTLASLTQSPLTIINKWIDETGFRYDDPRAIYNQTTSATVLNPQVLKFQNSWAVIIIMVEGQTNTTASCLSVEHILHSEAIPKKDSFILGSAAAPNSPGTMAAVSTMTGESDFSHTEAGQESYIAQTLGAFVDGARNAGENVMSEVVLPVAQHAGRVAGHTAVNMAVGAIVGLGGIAGVNNQPGRLALQR